MRRLTQEEFDMLERDEHGQIVGITESFEFGGHVYLDQTPLEVPVNMQVPESVESMVARLVRLEQRKASEGEANMAEEMDDFEVDLEDPLASYQAVDMVPDLPEEDKSIERKGGDGNGGVKGKGRSAGGKSKVVGGAKRQSEEAGSGSSEEDSADSDEATR